MLQLHIDSTNKTVTSIMLIDNAKCRVVFYESNKDRYKTSNDYLFGNWRKHHFRFCNLVRGRTVEVTDKSQFNLIQAVVTEHNLTLSDATFRLVTAESAIDGINRLIELNNTDSVALNSRINKGLIVFLVVIVGAVFAQLL